jgi:hypothetical protein
LAVENLFHPFQPFIIGQKSLPPKIALQYNIPLIFYGENEAEYGNPIQTAETALRDGNYFSSGQYSNIYLSGTSIHDLRKYFGLEYNDLKIYMPVEPEQIRKNNVQVHYLGYYMKWHPQRNYYHAVEHGSFEASPERTPGTYSKYNSIDDKLDDLHYFTTYTKFGIGRATYDASQEIRSGDITRQEGIALVKRFDGEFPERFIDDLFRYLSIDPKEFSDASKMFEMPIMDRNYFMYLVDKFRSPHLWKYVNGNWRLRYNVWDEKHEIVTKQEDEGLSWKGNIYKPIRNRKVYE